MKRLILAVGLLLALVACDGAGTGPQPSTNGSSASEWQAGPILYGKNYSPSVRLRDQPGAVLAFAFPTDAEGIHYLTFVHGPLTGKSRIHIRYRIEADPSVLIYGVHCATRDPSLVTPYFQREDDDWSGKGIFETYRWWDETAMARGTLTPGEHEIDAPFSDDWKAVETKSAAKYPTEFKAALAHAQRVGITFANCTGAGHGAAASGPATFVLEEFTVQ